MDMSWESEKELEILLATSERGYSLIEKLIAEVEDVDDVTILSIKNQVNLGQYGVADIIVNWVDAPDALTNITVIELKNTELKECHIGQVLRYHTGLRRITRGSDYVIANPIIVTSNKKNRDNATFCLNYATDVEWFYTQMTLDGLTLCDLNEGDKEMWKFSEIPEGEEEKILAELENYGGN